MDVIGSDSNSHSGNAWACSGSGYEFGDGAVEGSAEFGDEAGGAGVGCS